MQTLADVIAAQKPDPDEREILRAEVRKPLPYEKEWNRPLR